MITAARLYIDEEMAREKKDETMLLYIAEIRRLKALLALPQRVRMDWKTGLEH